jgi:hypothetical protein
MFDESGAVIATHEKSTARRTLKLQQYFLHILFCFPPG